jgi:hypothetical protein
LSAESVCGLTQETTKVNLFVCIILKWTELGDAPGALCVVIVHFSDLGNRVSKASFLELTSANKAQAQNHKDKIKYIKRKTTKVNLSVCTILKWNIELEDAPGAHPVQSLCIFWIWVTEYQEQVL